MTSWAIRVSLIAAGAYGAAGSPCADVQAEQLASAVMMLLGILWSYRTKRKTTGRWRP